MRTLKSLVPALAIASVVLLAACGGGGSSSGASPATTAATTPSSDAGGGSAANGDGQGGGGSNINDPAVQQCLADKGVTMPSFPRRGQGEAPPDSAANPEGGGPRGGFGGGLDDATRQALQDCGVTFGRGGQGGGGGLGGAFNDPAVQQCLADKGITLPQRGAEQQPTEGSRPTIDDATRQAIQDCRAQATTTTTIAA